ncbi:MAG TPA: tetratricopeptide repeat protein [Blastocatellia bacterium]|nr:tetratricopeptide repeat protein [Blastocatellia bacterium]
MSFITRRPEMAITLLVLMLVALLPPQVNGQTGTNAPAAAAQAPPPKPLPTPDAATRRRAYVRYMEAHQLLSQRPLRISEVLAAFREVIRLDPTAAEPHADLGEVYLFYTQRLEEAEREGLEAIRLDPDCLNGHRLLARLYVFAVRVEKQPRPEVVSRAIREYEQVTRLDPANAEAWAFLADLYESKKETAKELQALERWAAAPVSNDLFYSRLTSSELSAERAYHQLSQLYLALGRTKEAIDAARRAYEMEPESPEYASNLIRILRRAPTIADELQIYAQLSRTADTPPLQIGYGAAQVRAGQYAQAVERLHTAVRRDPTNSSAVSLLAIALRRAGRRQEAVETLKQGIAQAEESAKPGLRISLAETCDEMGKSEEALAQYEQIFEGLIAQGKPEPQTLSLLSDVASRLVRLYLRVGNRQRLQSVYARAQKLLGETSPLLDSITIETLREEGKKHEALEQTRAAARRHPEERSFRFTEALLLSETGNFTESVELLRSMISDHPEASAEDAGVYLILSSVQLQTGQFTEAEASVRRALELSPGDDNLMIHLSSVQDRAGRHKDSEKTLREVLQRDPENATALNNLGYFLTGRGERLEEAVRLIERAVNIEPTNGNFLDSLGWANYKLGRLEQARMQLEKARLYARNNATIYEHLGDVLRDLGRVSEARKHWEKALQLSVEASEVARLKDKLKIALK